MYKIILNNKIIDVVKHPRFIKFLSSGYVAMSDKDSATGIVGSDGTLYSFKVLKQNIDIVTIEEISETEFNRLEVLLNSDKSVSADQVALTKTKLAKLDLLSGMCRDKITAGFTILLDGQSLGFKLTTEDQINLSMIENQLIAGETSFIYHATNRPCQVFSKADMTKIIRAFRKHVLFHTTYYNIAKQHIMALTDIDDVLAFEYGTDITSEVTDAKIKQILRSGGV